jgi:hypothetical protein
MPWAHTNGRETSRCFRCYAFTCQLATLEPPPPGMQQMLGAIQGNQAAMDAFAQMNAGTITPAAFDTVAAAAQPPGSRSQVV